MTLYYLYFPYVAVLASLMLYDCHKRSQPWWWAVIVFFAPVTTPYFIFKSHKKSRLIYLMVFLITFSAMAGLEVFLYSKYMDKNRYSKESLVTRKIVQLSEELKTGTLKLDHALTELENLSKVESRIHEIKNTLEFIKQLRVMMIENQEIITQIVTLTFDHESYFLKKNLIWVLNIKDFYQNRNVIQHNRSLEKYLNAFAELLKYTYVNFYNITEYKSNEHLKNYDEYYLRYRRAVDSHNRFNVKRIDYQNQFIKKYPDVSSYLPGERQTETFNLLE